MNNEKLLIAIDGNSLMHRAYYALPSTMTSEDGTPTNAVHGFLSMLLKLIDRGPSHLVVAFDVHGPTFRHETYKEYKAGRRETPADLRPQFPLLQEILRQMGIRVSTARGFEADDILGTAARLAQNDGMPALLVTGDRDALQLVGDSTHVLLTKKGITDTVEVDIATLNELYGLTPVQMPDLKGLMGDSSDNIPGIPGVGEKSAIKLLHMYGSMENVLAHAMDVKGKLGEKIADSAGLARLSYKLGLIDTHVPLPYTLADCAFDPARMVAAAPLLHQKQLNAIAKRLPRGDVAATAPKSAQRATIKKISITDLPALQAALARVGEGTSFAFYVGADTLCFAGEEDREYSVCFNGTLLEPGIEPETALAMLKPILEDAGIEKRVYDGKKCMHFLYAFGIALRGLTFDAMIADYLLNAIRPAASLEVLTQARLGESAGAAALWRLYTPMTGELMAKGLDGLCSEVEMPLVGVLYRMEKQGFRVDETVLNALGAQYMVRIADLEGQIYESAGERFNILSPRQLGCVLFDRLGLPVQRKTKTGYSTDSDVLDALYDMHPIVSFIQEYRFLTKLRSTFIEGLLQARSPADGRVHTSFNQNVTATGRISSTEPNLQNIPVRTDMGREIRKAFIPGEGNVLIGADYSQIELRLLAHISGDETLTQAFLSGGDIHTKTAAEVFGVPEDRVTPAQRSAAKAVNFGIVYGISDFGLAKNLGISRKQAGDYIETYLNRYPNVRAYMQKSVEDGKENGYVATLWGRRRDLPELKSGQYNARSFGERVAMNMPIQGSAADIIKIAMVRVDEALLKRRLKAKLVLQVHDELLLDAPPEEKDACMELVRDCMQNAMRLRVPLLAQVRAGKSWFDTK
ncbi:MAG: DNA polymerase I [Clostridiales bacterium]|jgi:DNA polymerase-1|nr:DNA polymerase I [Clostridiales bacterium]